MDVPTPTMTTFAAGGSVLAGDHLALLVLVLLALLGLLVAAVASILTSARLAGAGKAMWVLNFWVLQFSGPLLWVLWGRRYDFSAAR